MKKGDARDKLGDARDKLGDARDKVPQTKVPYNWSKYEKSRKLGGFDVGNWSNEKQVGK